MFPLLVITKSVNRAFCMFWWAPVNLNIVGYSLFYNWSQDDISFQDIFEDEIWMINEAVVQKTAKKATNFGLSVFTGM